MPSYVVSIIVSAALGILLGWLAVLALKSAARALGCLVVVLFIAVQILGYYGLVEWDWAAFFEHLKPVPGLAGDALQTGVSALAYNLPMAVGFLLGLLLGIRSRSG